MMWKRGTGNGKQGTGKGKHETGNRKQGASHVGRKNEKWEQKQRKEMKILIGLRFQPRSQGSLSYPSLRTLDEKEREPGNEVAGVQVRFCSRFSFSRSRFSNMPKKSYLDNPFYQEAGDWK